MPPANQCVEVRVVSAEGGRIEAPKAQSGVEYGEGGLAILHTTKGLGNVVTRELPAGCRVGGGGRSPGEIAPFCTDMPKYLRARPRFGGSYLSRRRTAPVHRHIEASACSHGLNGSRS